MRRTRTTPCQQWLRAALLLIAAASGCDVSSDDGPNRFALCGNSVLDRNEECDDGNLADSDDCLSTCVFNQCGDEFLDVQGPNYVEVCDGRVLAGRTCTSLGFQGGTLACASDCASYDTSQCTPQATPTPTPSATVTPTFP